MSTLRELVAAALIRICGRGESFERLIRQVIMGAEQRVETEPSLATTSRRHVSESPATGRDAEVGTGTSQAAAFQRLADEHIGHAYRLANAILRNPSDAEDAVHDAFVTAWSHWSSLRDEGRFEAWFGRIVVNTCRDRLRQITRWRLTDISDEVGLSTPDAASAVHDREQVVAALGRLRARRPDRARAPLLPRPQGRRDRRAPRNPARDSHLPPPERP